MMQAQAEHVSTENETVKCDHAVVPLKIEDDRVREWICVKCFDKFKSQRSRHVATRKQEIVAMSKLFFSALGRLTMKDANLLAFGTGDWAETREAVQRVQDMIELLRKMACEEKPE